MSNIKAKGINAVKWSLISSFGRYFLQIISQIVIARILGPAEFGVFSMALVVMVFAAFVAEIGFGWSLVNRKEVHDDDIRLAFTWQVCVGALGTASIIVFSEHIAGFFHEPRVAGIVSLTAITCLLSAASSPATNLLIRELRFKELGTIQILSYFLGYIVIGIPMAVMGFGVVSLIAAWNIQALVRLIGSYHRCRHSLKPLFWHTSAKTTLEFGATVFATNLVNWVLSNLDRIIVGNRLRDRDMGMYTASANLASTPNSLLIGALQPAFFSASAKIQDDPARLASAYQQVISASLTVVWPVYWIAAGVSDAATMTLYGEKWVGAGSVLKILLLSMPAYIIWGMTTPILWNIGKKHMESVLQLPVIAALAGLAYVGAAHGPTGIALAASATLILRAAVLSLYVSRRLRIDWGTLSIDAARGALLATMGLAATTWASQTLSALPHAVNLLLSGLVGASASILPYIAFPRLRSAASVELVMKLVPQLSKFLRLSPK